MCFIIHTLNLSFSGCINLMPLGTSSDLSFIDRRRSLIGNCKFGSANWFSFWDLPVICLCLFRQELPEQWSRSELITELTTWSVTWKRVNMAQVLHSDQHPGWETCQTGSQWSKLIHSAEVSANEPSNNVTFF